MLTGTLPLKLKNAGSFVGNVDLGKLPRLSVAVKRGLLKRPSQRGHLFPCSPEINWLVALFPKITKKCFLMFPVSQYCSLKPLGGPH